MMALGDENEGIAVCTVAPTTRSSKRKPGLQTKPTDAILIEIDVASVEFSSRGEF